MSVNPSLALIPCAYDTGKLYSVLPENGTGDFNVSRNGTATYFDKDGVLRTALPNEPRLQFNPNGSFKGVLVEPSATNLRPNSNGGLAGLNAGQVLNNQGIAPDGVTQYQKLILGTTPNDSCTLGIPNISVAPSTTYTYSFYAVRLVGNGNLGIRFDTNMGVLQFTQIINIPTTVNRISYTFTTKSTDNILTFNSRFFNQNNNNGEFLIWGHQLEVGPVATSYIPTVASTVTRPADQMTVTVPIGATQCVYVLNGTEVTVPVIGGTTFSLPNGHITKLYMI